MINPDITRYSPNFNPRPVNGKTVIIHATRSGESMNASEFEGCLNYMGTPGTTSSHWVISREGQKARVVDDNLQAWHAAEDNDNCWGIELEQGAEQDGFTQVQIDACIAVCRAYMADFGVPALHVADSTQAGFIGHEETRQGIGSGKSDPGYEFPWDNFIAQLSGTPTAADPALPLAEEVAHATPYLYAAFYEREPSRLHEYDAGVIQRALEWWRSA